jgi:predicted TIM-barrel fold metal-dependent hydrolase
MPTSMPAPGSLWSRRLTDWSAMPNDGDLADLLAHWVPDAGVRERILVANPARLYGFEPVGK